MVGKKTRPIVLLSRDSHLKTRKMILASPITSRIRNVESEVALGPEDRLSKRCVVNAATVDLIPKTRLIRHIWTLSMAKQDALDAALRFSLGLD